MKPKNLSKIFGQFVGKEVQLIEFDALPGSTRKNIALEKPKGTDPVYSGIEAAAASNGLILRIAQPYTARAGMPRDNEVTIDFENKDKKWFVKGFRMSAPR